MGDLTACSDVSGQRNTGFPTGPRTYGNGVLIVLSVRESRTHGKGAQTLFIPGNREEHEICDRPKLSSVCFKIEANEGCRYTTCIDNSTIPICTCEPMLAFTLIMEP
jgi:hypothetical protein